MLSYLCLLLGTLDLTDDAVRKWLLSSRRDPLENSSRGSGKWTLYYGGQKVSTSD